MAQVRSAFVALAFAAVLLGTLLHGSDRPSSRGALPEVPAAREGAPAVAWAEPSPSVSRLPLDVGGGIQVVDVADPAHPVVRARLAQPLYTFGVALVGDHAYVAAGLHGVAVVDVTDPLQPQVLESLSLPGAAEGIAAAGRFLFVAAGFAGVRLVDAAAPEQPVEVGAIGEGHPARGVMADGGRLYVADGLGSVQIYEVEDPLQPRPLRQLAPDRTTLWTPATLGEAFAAYFGGQVGADEGATAPARARATGFLADWHVVGLVAEADLLYIADAACGLRIVASDAAPAARERGGLAMPAQTTGVAVSGHYAYVATAPSNLWALCSGDRPASAGGA